MDILNNVYIKNIFKRYLSLTIALIISALCFNLLLSPINLVAGGTNGLAIVLEQILGISSNDLITIIYIIMFLLSFLLLGKDSFVGLLYASIIYPLLVNLTSGISSVIVINYNDPFLIAIFAGILSGISGGLTYKNDFAASGIGVIAPIMHKYFKLSISGVNFVINTIIVLLGGYYFGIDMILYAIILLYLNSYICNIIILGVSYHKALFIRSKSIDKISEYLYKIHGINPTILNVHGGYTNEEGSLLLVVIPTLKYSRIKKELMKIDQDIFFVTCNSYELNYKN